MNDFFSLQIKFQGNIHSVLCMGNSHRGLGHSLNLDDSGANYGSVDSILVLPKNEKKELLLNHRSSFAHIQYFAVSVKMHLIMFHPISDAPDAWPCTVLVFKK